jgi:hypothetical protein
MSRVDFEAKHTLTTSPHQHTEASHTALHRIALALHCIMHSSTLHTAIKCSELNCAALHLHSVASNCIELHRYASNCVALHCIALHCINSHNHFPAIYCDALLCTVCIYTATLLYGSASKCITVNYNRLHRIVSYCKELCFALYRIGAMMLRSAEKRVELLR